MSFKIDSIKLTMKGMFASSYCGVSFLETFPVFLESTSTFTKCCTFTVTVLSEVARRDFLRSNQVVMISLQTLFLLIAQSQEMYDVGHGAQC